MPFGKIYAWKNNPRTTSILIVAKLNNIKLDFRPVGPAPAVPLTEEFLKEFPVGRVPGFIGADGLKLHETMAINVYLAQQNENTDLLGKNNLELAEIFKWMSFFNTDLMWTLAVAFKPILGRTPYVEKDYKEAVVKSNFIIEKVVEEHLKNHTYLVGDRITLADYFCAGLLSRGFETIFGKEWRNEHPHTSRWFTTMVNQPVYKELFGEYKFLDAPRPPPSKK